MTGKNALAMLLAVVMAAGVIGTCSVAGAEDRGENLVQPPRAERERARDRDEQRPLARRGQDERAEALRREREERLRREREEAERRMEEEAERARRVRERREVLPRERVGPMVEPRPFRPEHVDQFRGMMEMIERMRHTCFDPEAAAMVAAAGLKDDVPRRPEEIIGDLEGMLERTRTLGLRNALRLILRDLYRHRGEHDKVLENLRQMLAENDAALQGKGGMGGKPKPAAKPPHKPAHKPVHKPIGKPVAKPVHKAAGKPVGKPAAKPVR